MGATGQAKQMKKDTLSRDRRQNYFGIHFPESLDSQLLKLFRHLKEKVLETKTKKRNRKRTCDGIAGLGATYLSIA